MEVNLKSLRAELYSLADPKRGKLLKGFFKTGKGEYGEGDVFLGITVPEVRIVAKKYRGIKMVDVRTMLNSEKHEERLTAILILVENYKKADVSEKKKIFDFYISNLSRINNWDLVDLSAHKIVGDFIYGKNKAIIYSLAKSKDLWERRVAVIATFNFIGRGEFEDSLKIAKMLLRDDHDLIHKAVGWMLREIGKRELAVEEKFLKEHYKSMPRTMLRYSIERFEEGKRQRYLHGEI